MSTPDRLRITPRGPFSLAESSRFLCGFTPATGACDATPGVLSLAFLDDRTFAPVVARVRQEPDGAVRADVGAEHAAQIARILSLDHDALGLAAVAARDPIVARLWAARPGFRPVCFASPYEAAVWGVLAQRCPMPVAAAMKRALARATGGSVELGGATFDASPRPLGLLELDAFPGLPAEKLARLRGIARAALDGELDAGALRAMDPERARERLRSLRGIGPWTAGHVLVRGAGTVDELPLEEPRVARAVGEAYALCPAPTRATIVRLAEAWRPFRTWVVVRLVTELSAEGWRAPRRARPARPARTPRQLRLTA